jgi:arginase
MIFIKKYNLLKKLMIIYFPHKLGQLKNGVQYTPKYLKKILSNRYVDVTCNNSFTNKEFNLKTNLNNLYITNSKIMTPKINIGGDHSMAIATIANSLNIHKDKLKVLWFDAHPDINTYESSLTKNYHGMSLSYLTGHGENEFQFIEHKLNLKNLMYIGIRDIDHYEKEIIKDYNIQYISVNQINNNLYESIQKINNFIDNDPIHISFDVDCMDPTIINCTGTKSKYGLNLNTKIILDYLAKTNVCNIDITELNLELGNNKDKLKTIHNLSKLFESYLDFNKTNRIYF